MDSAKQNYRIQQGVTALSILLFAAKLIAYYFTGSVAVLSDALESIVNVLAGFIGLYSLYVAAKPRDQEHPFGHGKAEFISSGIEGGLIIASGVLILYQAANNIINDHVVQQLDAGLIIISITAILNFFAGIFCSTVGKKNHSLALQATGRHLKVDTYSTLIIIAALVAIYYTGNNWIDIVVAIILSVVIMYNGYKIIRKSLAGIMDEADLVLLQAMINLLNKNRKENWIDLHNLRIINYGSIMHMEVHLTVPWYLNVNEAHNEIDALTDLLTEEYGDRIQFAVHSDGCQNFSCNICTKEFCTVRRHPFKKQLTWTLKNISSNEKHRLDSDVLF